MSAGDWFADYIMGGDGGVNKNSYTPEEQKYFRSLFPQTQFTRGGVALTPWTSPVDPNNAYAYQQDQNGDLTSAAATQSYNSGQPQFRQADFSKGKSGWGILGSLAKIGMTAGGAQAAANAFLPGASAAYGNAIGAGANWGTHAAAAGVNPTSGAAPSGADSMARQFSQNALENFDEGGYADLFTPTSAGVGGGGGGGMTTADIIKKYLGGGNDGSNSWTSPKTIMGLAQLGMGMAGSAMSNHTPTPYEGDLAPPNQLASLIKMLSEKYTSMQQAQRNPVIRRPLRIQPQEQA